MRQYFVDEILTVGQKLSLNEEIRHHLIDVLRFSIGDSIRLVDKTNQPFKAYICSVKPLTAVIREKDEMSEKKGRIVYCCCMIKKDRWEWLIEKGVEFNCNVIVPVISERTIIHIDEKIDKKVERWNKIALMAAQQCNRTDLVKVEKPIKLKQIVQYKSANNLVAYEKEKGSYLYDLIDDNDITFLIGPEGGFSENEISFLTDNGFKCCSLSDNILKAESAGMYFLSVIDAKRKKI
ncbi:MAG: RsmE family RNA methyltransferase [Erysipelotrichaceae bacterium]